MLKIDSDLQGHGGNSHDLMTCNINVQSDMEVYLPKPADEQHFIPKQPQRWPCKNKQ
jgi:hypothetical protein